MNINYNISFEVACAIGTLGVSFVIFLYYYLFRFTKVVGYRFSDRLGAQESGKCADVSVVVVVGDDLDYIENGIPLLLNQKYEGNFEVIVVHDSPEDERSISMLDIMASQNSQLYLTRIKRDGKFTHTQKLAITVGLKAARYPNVILTEPSGYVASDKWLGFMASGFISENSLVCGVGYRAYAKGILNQITRAIETTESFITLSCAVAQKPYMAQSATNMGYTTKMFFGSGGFRNYLRYNGGNNDLFVQGLKGKIDNCSVIMNPQAAVHIKDRTQGLSKWYQSRKFNSYSRRYYPMGVRMFSAVHSISSLMFWLSIGMLLWMQQMPLYIAAGSIVVARFAIMILVARGLSKRTGIKVPYITYLLSDIFIFIDNLVLSIIRRVKPNRGLWL